MAAQTRSAGWRFSMVLEAGSSAGDVTTAFGSSFGDVLLAAEALSCACDHLRDRPAGLYVAIASCKRRESGA